MLTDFTEENGATHVVPGTHKSPRPAGDYADCPSVPIVGEAGDMFLWHMGVAHRSGASTASPGAPRVLSDRHFRKTATGYDKKTAIKWSSCPEK
jgi:ectoine hydroxylase-related dioxygenase (phytanoyl-CoA dioxygenase family)